MIAFVRNEDLRLVSEATESRRMDDTIPVALEFAARRRRGVGEQPPAARPGVRSKDGTWRSLADLHERFPPAAAWPRVERPRRGAYMCAVVEARPAGETRAWTRRRTEVSMSDVAELPVDVTERAARRIQAVLSKEPAGSMLRVAVNGGGCSGFQYAFDITDRREPDDLVIERNGA